MGTLNNRAYRMGIKRKGYYTLDEVLRVLSTPMKSYKLFDTEYVELLREKLIERLGTATKQEADRNNLRNGG